MRLLFPTAIRLNRGNLVLPELVRSAQSERLTDVILLHEHRFVPPFPNDNRHGSN